jgi:transcriptional regulator with XRE-family HTH domain
MPRTRLAVLEERDADARAVGRLLAAARERAALSQLDVARAIGVPQSQIAKLELGLRQLRFVEGLRLAALYSIPPTDLDPGSRRD